MGCRSGNSSLALTIVNILSFTLQLLHAANRTRVHWQYKHVTGNPGTWRLAILVTWLAIQATWLAIQATWLAIRARGDWQYGHCCQNVHSAQWGLANRSFSLIIYNSLASWNVCLASLFTTKARAVAAGPADTNNCHRLKRWPTTFNSWDNWNCTNTVSSF